MIIGYNYFGKSVDGILFDTAIPTSNLDEVIVGAGIYDEIFVSVDTTITNQNVKPDKWQLKTIMDAKFKNDIEAGSLDSDGHEITRIQIYRKESNEDNWLLMGQFDYDINYNVYSFLDRFPENGATYEYAIVPVAKDVIGDITVSEPVKAEYDGVFISDLYGNHRMEVDFELGAVTHNNNMSTMTPLNGRYPIVTQGNQDYVTGNLSFLPLTKEQVDSGGMTVNGRAERIYRNEVVQFLKSGGAKVIRNDNGEMMIVATHGVVTTSKNGGLVDISAVSFDFTEIGKFDYETMSKGGLIGSAGKSKYTFDENGNIEWAIEFDELTQALRRDYRNSPPRVVELNG